MNSIREKLHDVTADAVLCAAWSSVEALYYWNTESNIAWALEKDPAGPPGKYINESGNDWTDRIHPDDKDRVERALNDSIAQVNDFDCKYRLRERQGDGYISVRSQASVSRHNDSVVVFGNVVDISALESLTARSDSLDRKLQSRTAIYSSLIDNAVDAIIAIDEDGKILVANEAVRQLFGHDPEEVIGQPITKLMPARIASEHDGYIRHYIRTGEKRIIGKGRRVEGLHRDGSTIQVELGVSEVPNVGDRHVFAGILRDVREQIQREEDDRVIQHELQRSNDELTKFAYVASHDLQEPVRKIRSYIDIILEDCQESLDMDLKNYLDRVDDAASRMSTLISDLLAYSRVGRGDSEPKSISIKEVVDGVISDLEIAMRDTQATVKNDITNNVTASETALRQVFQNLISNSIKFRDASRDPVVTMRQFDTAQPGFLGIIYEDNGIGFEETYEEKIFDLFQRLHGRSEYEGTGLGLAICKKYIESIGGSIKARGRPGEGAIFILELPISDT